MRRVVVFLCLSAAVVLALGAYIRFAPSDPALWHVDPVAAFTGAEPVGEVVPQRNGALLRLAGGAEVLARLDAVATATPRTVRLAGSVAEGRITWSTRSALWGFPDYTTAGVAADGVYIHARQGIGDYDWGVNAARLRGWLAGGE